LVKACGPIVVVVVLEAVVVVLEVEVVVAIVDVVELEVPVVVVVTIVEVLEREVVVESIGVEPGPQLLHKNSTREATTQPTSLFVFIFISYKYHSMNNRRSF
jgi:hypothetical protein